MNENLAAVADQKICGQLSTGKVIVVDLFEITADTFKNGIAIPNTIELVGYDNSPVSNYAVHSITSIDQNIPLMAQIAIQSLENYIPYESMVPATLVEKETTS